MISYSKAELQERLIMNGLYRRKTVECEIRRGFGKYQSTNTSCEYKEYRKRSCEKNSKLLKKVMDDKAVLCFERRRFIIF